MGGKVIVMGCNSSEIDYALYMLIQVTMIDAGEVITFAEYVDHIPQCLPNGFLVTVNKEYRFFPVSYDQNRDKVSDIAEKMFLDSLKYDANAALDIIEDGEWSGGGSGIDFAILLGKSLFNNKKGKVM